MKAKIVIVVLLGFFSDARTQIQSYLFDKETLIKNRVSKIEQSTAEFQNGKELPHKYYALIDKEGQMIEVNKYEDLRDRGLIEYIERTLFDEEGQYVGKIMNYLDSAHSLKQVYFQLQDSVSKKTHFAGLANWHGEGYYVHMDESPMHAEKTMDTIWVSSRHARVPSHSFLEDSSSLKDIYFNKKGRIDSIACLEYVFSKPRLEKVPVKTYFHYAPDGRLKSKIEKHFDRNSKNKPYRWEEFHYFDNGLLELRITRYNSGIEAEEIRYTYQFRTD